MRFSREQKLAVLQGCVDLPILDDRERSLLRDLTIAIGTGNQLSPVLAEPVRALLNKIGDYVSCSTG